MAKADKTDARKRPAAKQAAKKAAPAARPAQMATAAPPAGKKAVAKKAAAKPAAKDKKEEAPAARKPRKPAVPPRAAETASDLLAFPEAAARVGGRSGKYVYCIVHTNDPCRFGPIGIGSEPAEVHTVNYKDIAAVVSDTPLEVYDPTRENVLAHERVNEVVMRDFTVIPMSFSTVFKTSEDIVELLRSAYDAFRDVLVKMQDKLEFGLKVLWEPETVIREIEKEDENLRLLRQETWRTLRENGVAVGRML